MSVIKHNIDMYATKDFVELFDILNGVISISALEKSINNKYKVFNRVIVV